MARRAPPVIPPDFLDAGLPTGTYSPSQHACFKTCGRAYEFRYVERLRTAANVGMMRGTVVHAGVEMAHRRLLETGVAPSLEEARAAIADSFEAEHVEVVDWQDAKPGAVKDEALGLYTRYHLEALPRVDPVEVEQHHLGHIGGVPTQAYVDLVDHVHGPPLDGVEDPGTLVLADLKTTTTTWSEDDLRRDAQFTAYSMIRGLPVVRVDNLVQLKAGPRLTQRTATRTRQDYAVLAEDYAETTDLIKRGVFPKTSVESWACTAKWCAYWDRCRGRKR